jgi:hypothetical protein
MENGLLRLVQPLPLPPSPAAECYNFSERVRRYFG